QGRAYRMALVSLRHREDALDAVQDAMMKLVEKYSDKPQEQWAPLFYRILYTRIKDSQRRRVRGGRLFGSLFGAVASGSEDEIDVISQVRDASDPDPLRLADDDKFGDALDSALGQLPERQRQAFLLRAWEGLDVGQTATAMGCGEGSVKTHYSRARQSLQRALGDFVA
ncbi:MAG: RNA polymerase sigma factor, partial [Pseudomonadales bacterium]